MPDLELEGAPLSYVEEGKGEPLVLVHGSGSDRRTWDDQVPELARRFRAIAYSRRYHWPNEPIPDGADYPMALHVDDLGALLRALGLEEVHLVGHSYGALVSLNLAIRNPSRIRSLVLTEPPVLPLLVSDPPTPWEILKLFVTRPRTAVAVLSFGIRGRGPATAAARRGEMEEACRRARVPGASHLVHEDSPGAWRRAVLSFLEGLDSGR